MCNNDAVLWKREEKVGFDHKMLWFEGKNQAEKWLVFAQFFCPFLKMHKGKGGFGSHYVAGRIDRQINK